MDHLARVRRVGYVEGLSFLILLGIAMPLKWFAGKPMAVTVFGWFHGLMFMLYIAVAIQAYRALKWPRAKLLGAFAASVLPFGPFVFERWLRKN